MRGTGQRPRSRTASRSSASTRGRLPGSPPPVMWATAWTSTPAAATGSPGRRSPRGASSSSASVQEPAPSHAGPIEGTARPRPAAPGGPASSRWIAGQARAGRSARRPTAVWAGPSTMASRSTMPTAKPATSNSPGSSSPGCSASSPPTMAHPARRHPAVMPVITWRTCSGSIRPAAGSRGRRAAGPRSTPGRPRTWRPGRSRPCRSGRSAMATAILVPTPSVLETSTGRR